MNNKQDKKAELQIEIWTQYNFRVVLSAPLLIYVAAGLLTHEFAWIAMITDYILLGFSISISLLSYLKSFEVDSNDVDLAILKKEHMCGFVAVIYLVLHIVFKCIIFEKKRMIVLVIFSILEVVLLIVEYLWGKKLIREGVVRSVDANA